MQDVHTASSSSNSIFAFTALRSRLAPEGRWYTNEPVALMDLWQPRRPLVVHMTTNPASPR
jgi:hypothetical protein